MPPIDGGGQIAIAVTQPVVLVVVVDDAGAGTVNWPFEIDFQCFSRRTFFIFEIEDEISGSD